MSRPRTSIRLNVDSLVLRYRSTTKTIYQIIRREFQIMHSQRVYNRLRRMIQRSRKYFRELKKFTSKTELCRTPRLMSILNDNFNNIRTVLKDALIIGNVLHFTVDFRDLVTGERWSLNYRFPFDVHGGGCGEHVKVEHYSFNLPWSLFGVKRACRVVLESRTKKFSLKFWNRRTKKFRLSPRFVIFDCSSRHNHEPHIETDSLETFLEMMLFSLKGYCGLPLWVKLGVKEIASFHGRSHKSVAYEKCDIRITSN